MFTKQHYVAIAAVLRANQPGKPVANSSKEHRARCDHHRCIVDQLANLFVQDDPQFDWQKFIDAATRPE